MDRLEDNANFMANWYVWVPCVALLAVLLIGVVVAVVLLVVNLGRRRRPRD
jgi:CHASE1-domain containing sensor protein